MAISCCLGEPGGARHHAELVVVADQRRAAVDAAEDLRGLSRRGVCLPGSKM